MYIYYIYIYIYIIHLLTFKEETETIQDAKKRRTSKSLN